MLELLLVLTPISLVDSLSMWPACIVPMTIALGGARPLASALAFIAGILAVYLPFGIAIAFGLSRAVDALNERFKQVWYHPDTLDVWLGVVIGVTMIVIGWKVSTARGERKAGAAPAQLTAWPAFGLAAAMTVAGAWGALPYFAAVDQILKADPGTTGAVLALAYYNVIFVLPLVAFASLRPLLGDRADAIFAAINEVLVHWGKRVLVVALVLIGAVMVADSIGWLLGHPLIPVGAP